MNNGLTQVSTAAKDALSVGCLALVLLASSVWGNNDHFDTDIAKGYVLQLGAYRSLANAEKALSMLNAPNAAIASHADGNGELYLIVTGGYMTLPEARTGAELLLSKNPGAEYWIRSASNLQKLPNEDSRAISVDTSGNLTTVQRPDKEQDVATGPEPYSQHRRANKSAADSFELKVDEVWGEYGMFPTSRSSADQQAYIHSRATANWSPNHRWEFQLSGRVDGYYQRGDIDTNNFQMDYAESYVRYNQDNFRLTIGTQKVLWGRIDEFPPTDRLSTQDLSRFVLDDLADRRRASPAIRYEYYSGNSKIDVVLFPFFRAAELPEEGSVWFPINQTSGEVFGLKSSPITSEIIKNAVIALDKPDSEGGAGIRYTGIAANLDYGLTVQRGRQTVPYFTYNTLEETISDVYPRTWVVGGDLGFEAVGGTLMFEFSWLSDTPVTDLNGVFSTVESINWGGSYEFFPGDGDARVNLQLMGNNLFNTPQVFDRTEVYSLSGSFETPFAENTWRFKTRFYFGLGENDIYINPEITYIGWPSQELYFEAHYFDGSTGTPGGFHKNHSVLTSGWRIKF